MSWSVRWAPAAERDLRNIPWQLAAKIDAGVMALAEGQRPDGSVERMQKNDPHKFRIRYRRASALLWVDRSSRTIYVARVLPNA